MKKWGIFLFTVFLSSSLSFGNSGHQENGSIMLIRTDYGDIKVRLFTRTGEHKRNFEKLVGEGFYDGLLFHRVIENFMIQGGDPDSKNAEPGQQLGGGSLDYTLPAEFVPEYFHKRGALAAARRGGERNPEKRSSASQFYIVQGKVFSPGALDTLEMAKNQRVKNELIKEHLAAVDDELQQFRKNNDREGFTRKVEAIKERVDSLIVANDMSFRFTPEQREIYTTIGGYPSLDGDYTVFGEVLEGMEVVDKIAAVETDKNNRPAEDVKMEIEQIK